MWIKRRFFLPLPKVTSVLESQQFLENIQTVILCLQVLSLPYERKEWSLMVNNWQLSWPQ